MLPYRRLLVLSAFVLCVQVCRAQQASGIQPYGTMITKGADVINVGNNNVFLNIPVLNKPGRGAPFTYSISLNSSIWYPTISGSYTTWMPVSYDGSALGWQGLNPAAAQGASYKLAINTIQCQYGSTTLYVYTPGGYLAPGGNFHGFEGSPVFSSVPTVPAGTNCPTFTPAPSNLITYDGSGYTATMNLQGSGGTGTVAFLLKDTQADTINTPVIAGQGAPTGPLTTTDANGNQITGNNGVYTDTTGTAALSLVYSTSPAKTTLQYNIPGGTASYQVMYSSYSVATNFQCANIVDYGPVSTNLVSQILLPGGGGTYLFSYEATPGKSGSVTGRVASVQLPSGGTISYQYSGGNNGISCTDGSTPTLTRVTTDGTSTFARGTAGGANSTVTDEKSNQSIYNFIQASNGGGNVFETHRKIYQGSTTGTLLEEIVTCYNGTSSNCDNQSLGLPITEIDATSSFNGLSPLLTKTTYDSTGVVVTKTAQYNGSTLLASATNAYTISAPLYELNSTTVADASGNTVALTSYGHDEGTLTSTSGIPQHVNVAGPRGNLTSTHVSIDGTPSNTLNSSTVFYDTGQLVSMTTPSGKTTYSYDSTQTFATSTTMPTPSSGVTLATSAQYDVASGAILWATGLNTGQKTTVNQYDALMRPTQVTLPNNAVGNLSETPTLSIFSAANSSVQTQYDSYGRKSRVATYNGQTNPSTDWYQVDYCYDATGLLQYQSVPYAGSGFAGRINKEINADGMVVPVNNGRAVETVDVTGQVKTITQYDLLGRISGCARSPPTAACRVRDLP
jgi:hypothetical protein